VRDFDASVLHDVLAASAFDGLVEGFGANVELKHIPVDIEAVPMRSIVTLAVQPENCVLQIDNYGKLKAEFSDHSGVRRSYIPVNDIGLNHHVQAATSKPEAVAALNHHLRTQKSLYLRIGITRPWQTDDGRNGYWLQLNAAYSFPILHQSVEEY